MPSRNRDPRSAMTTNVALVKPQHLPGAQPPTTMTQQLRMEYQVADLSAQVGPFSPAEILEWWSPAADYLAPTRAQDPPGPPVAANSSGPPLGGLSFGGDRAWQARAGCEGAGHSGHCPHACGHASNHPVSCAQAAIRTASV